MGTVLPDFPEQSAVIPDQIVTRFINRESGELAHNEDPDGYMEYFVSGTEPTNAIQPLVNTSGPEEENVSRESVSETLF